MENQRLASSWVRSNDLWAVAANVGYALSQWVIVAFLARQSSAATLGEYTLALALSAPIFMCANMRLRFLQATDTSRRFEFVHYASVRGLSTALAAAFTFGVAWLSGFARPFLFVVIAVISVKMVECMQDIVVGVYQTRARMSAVARSLLLSGGLATLLFAISFILSGSLVLSCFVMALTRLITLAIIDVPTAIRYEAEAAAGTDRRDTPPLLSWHACRLLVLMAWPLGIVAMLDSLNTNVPRYLLAAVTDTSKVGQYSAIAYLAFAGFLVANSLCQSRIAHLARAVAQGEWPVVKHSIQSLFAGTATIGLIGVAAAVLGGDTILRILYGSAFVGDGDSFLYIMVAGALTYVALAMVYVLTAFGETRVQVVLYASNAAVVTAVGTLLVPTWGIRGAAVALAAANAVQILLSIVALRRCLGTKTRDVERQLS
jgi:O-antigen/teichoic acid export membrane protein